MLRIEEDAPDERRLVLVGTGWTVAERLRRTVVTGLLLLALTAAAVTAYQQALLWLLPLVGLAVIGMLGVQREQLEALRASPGALRVTLRGRWIWGRRTLTLLRGPQRKLLLEVDDVSAWGAERRELGLRLWADGYRLPETACEGVHHHGDARALAHRLAWALDVGIDPVERRYGSAFRLEPGLPAAEEPATLAAHTYRGGPSREALDLSRVARYVAPKSPLVKLPDIAASDLVTRLTRHALGWRIRGARPMRLILSAVALGVVLLILQERGRSEVRPLLTLALLGLMMGPGIRGAVSLLSRLVGLRPGAVPPTPTWAVWAGGALPDDGGVMVRRWGVPRRCGSDTGVFLVRRTRRPRRRGQRDTLRTWREVWVLERGHWSLLAKANPGPAPARSAEAIAHEAARRLDVPVRFTSQPA